ncbi:transposase, IS605 OrfB family [Candidatus Thiomargarita nelsonii]|uniref:Transposase, IS605 OrfB family n=1 Tax=Candidatus Thiomargarita nelsonii TaxID=1003181 RepID=A0A176S7Z5_9GAMM|nr:transposase, IS605 OrfB family [Candidatus Thiomargarita nelsonii]
MKKALKTKIRGLDKSQFKRLRELTHHAKNLYNQTLWTLREAFEATGKYFTYPQMDQAMKPVENLEGEINYRFLKSAVSQQILRRLDKNFKSFFEASEDFKQNPSKYKGQPRPPRFKKSQYDNLIYNTCAFQIKNGEVILDRTKGKELKIPLPLPLIGKTIKQVEIIPKPRSFQAVFVYEENQATYQQVVPNDKVMSIDLGLNNLATCVTNGVIKPFIIDGRRIKSINAYYNKRKAKIQSQLEKSRGRKWSNRLQQLTDWRNAIITDYLHKATAHVVKTCLTHEISKVIVGDVANSLDHINLGKKTNQNFVNLSLGQFIDKLRYKLGQHGIKLKVANESYTSKASFVDGDQMPKKYDKEAKPTYSGKRIKRGLYRSQDGTLVNADANGAYNILRKSESKFSFKKLVQQVGDYVRIWLHPTERVFIK